jgi:hypothetical protein
LKERPNLLWLLSFACAPLGIACTTLVGASDYVESPCEGPCADAAVTDTKETSDTHVTIDTHTQSDTAVEDSAPEAHSEVGACDGAAQKQIDVGGYSIDPTEVTNAQYAAFLDAKPTVVQDAWCAWNTSFTPAGTWPTASERCNEPVANVDWCDAAAYCKWAGKRLCGHRISGAVPYVGDGFVTAATDAWYNACSSGGANVYPYPGVYVARFCFDASYGGKTGVEPVASLTTCQPTATPFAGLFDLVGNVAEWQDSCDNIKGGSDHCRVRGGSFADDGTKARCNVATVEARNIATPDIGFRCCSK